MVNKIMEQDSNDEVQYVQNTSQSSRNSGGYSLTYRPSIKDMRSFFDDYHFGLSPT